MIAIRPRATQAARFVAWLLLALNAAIATGREPGTTVSEADPATIRAFFAGQGRFVLTFLGYSGAGYENPAAMLDQAGRVLARYDPRRTIVNAGATADGIGAVYRLARQRGFRTTGIVSGQARIERVPLSPWVDTVFYVRDATWGGFLPGTQTLSPTSQAMVDNSDALVAIGGGDVARDELIAARRQGRAVAFIPADLNHRRARAKARQHSLPEPTDFAGAAAGALERTR